MPKILVVYASNHGHTRRIAGRIAEVMRADGADVSLARADAAPAPPGWTPDHATTFAGALQYREYDFVTRLLMRTLMHKGHHPTDPSRDYDYTDWDAVERFARFIPRLLAVTFTARRGSWE